jgi:hypothetical protein
MGAHYICYVFGSPGFCIRKYELSEGGTDCSSLSIDVMVTLMVGIIVVVHQHRSANVVRSIACNSFLIRQIRSPCYKVLGMV